MGSSTFTDNWDSRQIHRRKRKRLEKLDSIPGFDRKGSHKDDIVLIPAVLPLPGLGTLDFLSALLSIPDRNVFDSDAMGLVLLVLWKAGIKQFFLIDFFLNSCFCVAWVLFVDTTASSTAKSSNSTVQVTALAWIILTLNGIFIGEQSLRFLRRRGHFFRS